MGEPETNKTRKRLVITRKEQTNGYQNLNENNKTANVATQADIQALLLEKENCLIGVVADGAGSVKFAEIGSQSLVKTMLEFINEHDLHFSNKLTIWQLLNADVTQLSKVWRAEIPTDE